MCCVFVREQEREEERSIPHRHFIRPKYKYIKYSYKEHSWQDIPGSKAQRALTVALINSLDQMRFYGGAGPPNEKCAPLPVAPILAQPP